MKKHFYLAAIAAIAVSTSCTKSEMVDVKTNAEILIGATTAQSTKASEATLNDLKGSSGTFSIEAYRSSDALASAFDGASYFSTTATWADSAWGISGGPYFWPSDATKLHFFAVGNNATASITAANGTAWPSITYTTGATSAAQEDLLAASVIDKGTADSANPINFVFSHILSQVNFSAKGIASGSSNKLTYNVTKIALKGLLPTGTFTFASTDIGQWDNVTGDATTLDYFSGAKSAEEGVSLDIVGENAAFMVIPQSASIIVDVTYSVTQNGVEIYNGTTSTTETTVAFGKGSNILINLVLPHNGTEITFTTDVSGWNESTSTDIN